MAWLLAQTMVQQEFRIRDRLREAPDPLEVYLPTCKRLIFPRHTRKPRLVAYPLFARYLFIWVVDLAREIEAIRARTRLVWPVRAEERRCIVVPERDVTLLRLRVEAGEFDELGEERIVIAIGSAVLVTQGLAAGQEGIVVEQRRHDRFKVALHNCSVVAGLEQLELAH